MYITLFLPSPQTQGDFDFTSRLCVDVLHRRLKTHGEGVRLGTWPYRLGIMHMGMGIGHIGHSTSELCGCLHTQVAPCRKVLVSPVSVFFSYLLCTIEMLCSLKCRFQSIDVKTFPLLSNPCWSQKEVPFNSFHFPELIMS